MPTNWRHIPLPKRPLFPLHHTWSKEFHRIRRQVTSPLVLREPRDVRVVCEVMHLRRDRPFRVMNQRQRLSACYWAGWTPFREKRRGPGGVWGPKWVGGRP